MRLVRSLALFALSFLATASVCGAAHKIRYRKASGRGHRDGDEDIFAFLSRIDPHPPDDAIHTSTDIGAAADPPPFTTPPSPAWVDAAPDPRSAWPPPRASTTPPTAASLNDYCTGPRGQFAFPPDCHRFVDCWSGRATLKDCFPKTLVFHPDSAQCRFPWDPAVKGRCAAGASGVRNDDERSSVGRRQKGGTAPNLLRSQTDFTKPSCSDFSHLGYKCVPRQHCKNGFYRNVSDPDAVHFGHDEEGTRKVVAKFAPWTKKCFYRHEVCCKTTRYGNKVSGQIKAKHSRASALQKTILCPEGYSGPQPYPPDCSKFANCWKGRPTVQSCAPGTHFNARSNQCDFPSKAKCHPDKKLRRDMMASREFEIGVDVARSSGEPDQLVSFPAPESGQRVRLRGGRSPYSGYLEMYRAGQWGFVCDAGTWTMREAGIVCRQLGFTRGARTTTQGLVNGPVNEERKLTEVVDCRGDETGLEKCRVDYSSAWSSTACKLSEEIVSVTCVHDSFAGCPVGEVPWGGACYSVHFERADFAGAAAQCAAEGKRLAEVTSQQENDLLSELLLQSEYSSGVLAEAWTGGRAASTARAPLYYWHGSRTGINLFRPWWPGWNGERKGISDPLSTGDIGDGGGGMGIKLTRRFDFASRRNRREQRLVDYYFWSLSDLREKLAFVCERPQTDIGCVEGDGSGYAGAAARGETGDECVQWDSPQLAFVLDEDNIQNLGPLEGNNFCRNPDGDAAPWCIAPNGEFDYCDIPQCNSRDAATDAEDLETSPATTAPVPPPSPSSSSVDAVMVASAARCAADEFQCGSSTPSRSECILSAYVCDGHRDCSNGRDEEGCGSDGLALFTKRAGRRVSSPHVERWLDSTAVSCAAHCGRARGFVCRSFGYNAARRLCTLSEDNVGRAGAEHDSQWDLYELKEEAVVCSEEEGRFACPGGKCLDADRVCDGKDDCGDGSDEKECREEPNVQVRLVGGKSPNEGRVEIKAFKYDFGGICDDGFGMEEASVVCRMAGFPLGATEAAINSRFGSGRPGQQILLDELDCQGSESSLLQCQFDPWTQHDCSHKEWAGVVCKAEDDEQCKSDEEWACGSGECVPLAFLCDGRKDCADGSDERSRGLCGLPIELRLAGNGDNATSGRVEVRYKGVWGTVCDDNFGEEEGAVVCRMLGFGEGVRAVVHSEAAFGAGDGPIWVQNLACRGGEDTLQECRSPAWQPTFQCKHLEDVGVECVPFKPETRVPLIEDNDEGPEERILRRGPDDVSVQCGQPLVEETPAVPVARIAGGLQSRPGAHPWAASIRLQGSARSFHWCGAVVLSEFHVLTVAHCMEDYPKDVYRVRVGDWDMQVPDVEEQEFRVEAVHFHDDYNVGLYLNNDIALVRVAGSHDAASGRVRGIRFGARVVPACLPPVNAVYGSHLNCSVSGWGSTGISKPGFTRYLQAASLPLLATEKCMSPNVYGPNKLGSSMFCAGYLEGGVDTCQGDSGGGMVCQVKGRRAVMGLTSWGYGCGRPNRPGVYTKVADYLEWIVEKMTQSVA